MEVATGTINTVLGQRAGLLDLVLKLLSPQDLKAAVLVCRLWREVGEQASYWAWVVLHVTRENMASLCEVLAWRRMARVGVLEVQEDLPGEQLKQMEPIFASMCEGVSSFKKLHISNTNLSTLGPVLLAGAVGRLEEVWVDGTTLTSQQATMVMTALCKEDSRLKILDISKNDLSEVEPNILAHAVNGLEEVDLNTTKLTVEEVEAIVNCIAQRDSKLKKLNISNARICMCHWGDKKARFTQPPELLASTVNKLEEVEMAFNSFSTKQLEAILSTIGQQKSNLKKLNISCNNLSSVDPLLLVRAVSRLEEINLDGTELTLMQARGIMLTIGFDKFSTLQKLVLSDNDLSKVKPDLFAKAVNRLEEVDMTNSQLTLEQMEAILKQSLVSTSPLEETLLDLSIYRFQISFSFSFGPPCLRAQKY